MKGINDSVSVTEGFAELISEIVFEGEIVEGTNEVTNPVTNSEKEVVGVVDGFLEVQWEHGRESLLSESGEEQNEGEEFSDHFGVTLVGASEFIITLGFLWG